MWTEISKLQDFYATSTGAVARRLIRQKLRAMWPNINGMSLLGFGYTTPYLRVFQGESERVVALMPAQQGAMAWPPEAPRLVGLCDETLFPLPDRSVDRVLLVHAIESSEALRRMLREVWRVLDDGGRLIVVAPSRRGIWARFERTPFGHGRPFTVDQINSVLRDAMFEPVCTEAALFVPPVRSRIILSAAPAWERMGNRLFGLLAGVTLTEATKQVYAGTPVNTGVRQPAKVVSTGASASRSGSE
jgi:SAM-dependent methyltransferase